jgi:hypothetical protein
MRDEQNKAQTLSDEPSNPEKLSVVERLSRWIPTHGNEHLLTPSERDIREAADLLLSLQERLDKLEADLVRVNGIIFGHGAPLGSEQYFEIRKICAAYEQARSALSPQTREGDK